MPNNICNFTPIRLSERAINERFKLIQNNLCYVIGQGGGGGGIAIGDSVSSSTDGSMLFVGTGGVLAQNNSDLFWDNTNSRLGIGINTSLDGDLVIDNGNGDFPAISIKHSYTGIKPFLKVQPPVQNSSTHNFVMYSAIDANDDLTYTNHIIKAGFNVGLNEHPTFPGIYTSMESHWITSGALYMEYHVPEIVLPNNETCRLASVTANVTPGTLLNSLSNWDFRGTSFNFMDLKDNGILAITKSDNLPNTSVNVIITGNQPTLHLSDSNTPLDIAIQNTGASLGVNSPIVGTGSAASSGAAFIATQFGGASGHADIALQRANGTLYLFTLSGASAGAGFANDFYMYDVANNQMPMRVKSNGHFMINGNGESDHGETLQVYGSGYFTGNLGINITPTARLHLPAGTATANTAPIKLTAGTNLTTPENGTFEFDGTNLYFTVGGVRKTVTLT